VYLRKTAKVSIRRRDYGHGRVSLLRQYCDIIVIVAHVILPHVLLTVHWLPFCTKINALIDFILMCLKRVLTVVRVASRAIECGSYVVGLGLDVELTAALVSPTLDRSSIFIDRVCWDLLLGIVSWRVEISISEVKALTVLGLVNFLFLIKEARLLSLESNC